MKDNEKWLAELFSSLYNSRLCNDHVREYYKMRTLWGITLNKTPIGIVNYNVT